METVFIFSQVFLLSLTDFERSTHEEKQPQLYN